MKGDTCVLLGVKGLIGSQFPLQPLTNRSNVYVVAQSLEVPWDTEVCWPWVVQWYIWPEGPTTGWRLVEKIWTDWRIFILIRRVKLRNRGGGEGARRSAFKWSKGNAGAVPMLRVRGLWPVVDGVGSLRGFHRNFGWWDVWRGGKCVGWVQVGAMFSCIRRGSGTECLCSVVVY